jgi:hypothetical protein
LVCTAAVANAQAPHPCAKDAKERAKPLLMLHFGYQPGETPQNLEIGDTVRTIAPIKALRGNGMFDVLEVQGYIYKAEYRLRFIYARVAGCPLMGQEILERSNPY